MESSDDGVHSVTIIHQKTLKMEDDLMVILNFGKLQLERYL